jgi:probable F420-dependent oxidoreductase
VKFGLFAAVANPFATPEMLAAMAHAADERGIDSIWVPEHVVLFEQYESQYPYSADGRIPGAPGMGMLEPFTTLAFLAAHSTNVRLATGVCLLPQRNPVYAAKEAANVDYLSDGRFDFGIGVGWLKEEFDVVNVPFERRGKRTDEYLEVLRTLWCDDPSEYHGELYDLPATNMFPKPVQQPHPPLHFGGESDAAMRRTARVGQGWHTFNRLPGDVPPLIEKLEGMLAEHDRKRDDVVITASPYFNGVTPEMVEQFAEAGVDQVTALFIASSPEEVEANLDGLQPCLDRAHAC